MVLEGAHGARGGEGLARHLHVRVLQPKLQRSHERVEHVGRQRGNLGGIRLQHVREEREILVAQLGKREELVGDERDDRVQPDEDHLRDVHLGERLAARGHPRAAADPTLRSRRAGGGGGEDGPPVRIPSRGFLILDVVVRVGDVREHA